MNWFSESGPGGVRPTGRSSRLYAAALVGVGLFGCGSKVPAGYPPASNGDTSTPSTSDGKTSASPVVPTDYDVAVSEYRGIVRLVANMPVLTNGEGIRRAIDLLETAIDRVPALSAAARSEAVRLMRSQEFDLWVSFRKKGPDSRALHDALQVAAGALQTAAGRYQSTEVKAAAADFEQATSNLEAAHPIDDQHDKIVSAFRRGLTVLEAIQKSERRSPTSSADQQMSSK